MKRIYLYFFLLILAVTGCKKKKYPEPAAPVDSAFYMKLLVDGQALDITAGKNDYSMYSNILFDSSNVYNLFGEFKQSGCGTCPNSIKIQINDSKTSIPGSQIDINSFLTLKRYGFLSGYKGPGYSVEFKSNTNKTGLSYLWDFGDGSTSTEINPTHVFDSGKYRVLLTVTDANMNQSTLVNNLSFTSARDLNTYITSTSVFDTVAFTAHTTGGSAPYKYLWAFGDGATSTLQNPKHVYAIDGGYSVQCLITDSAGRQSTGYYNVAAGAEGTVFTANYTLSKITSVTARSGLSKTSIWFTDATGTVFSSDNSLQPQSSSLEVISIEDFTSDISNKPVKRVKLKFNCTLYHGAQSVSLQGTDVLVGLVYQ